MIALSTSWKSSIIDDGETLLQAVKDLDVSEVELEYRITTAVFHQMRASLKRSGLSVAALHNYFPLPPEIDPSRASGDLFRLSHPDKEQRQIAVNLTQRSIEHANDLEAGAVILHCGHVNIAPELDKLHHYYHTGRIESEETLLVLELKPGTKDSAVSEGLRCLAENGIGDAMETDERST
jgi:sugar phosphate isomerase/epimerase